MNVRDLFGILTAIVVVAGIAVAVRNGGETAKVIDASANGFSNIVKAATLTS